MDKIKIPHQTDIQFPDTIRHYGCYFMSLIFQVSLNLDIAIFNTQYILDLYNAEVADFDIGDECYLSNPQGLCDAMARNRILFIGIKDKEYVVQDGEFEIQRWYNPSSDFHHFVAAHDGVVTYDPIEGGSRTVREGVVDSKRIFKVL